MDLEKFEKEELPKIKESMILEVLKEAYEQIGQLMLKGGTGDDPTIRTKLRVVISLLEKNESGVGK